MNILVVDDHPLTCQGIAALLTSSNSHARIQSAHSASVAREQLLRLPAPDWIFLDINLADDLKHEFFRDLCETPWIGHTILISAEPEHRLVRTALAAGARGFIPKTADPNLVLDGFRRILDGEFYVPRELQQTLKLRPNDPDSARGLSPRLRQVQAHLLRGSSNKVIARELELSAHTVKEYVSSVLAFNGVNSRLDLILKFSITK